MLAASVSACIRQVDVPVHDCATIMDPKHSTYVHTSIGPIQRKRLKSHSTPSTSYVWNHLIDAG